jgi:hypothetical protein
MASTPGGDMRQPASEPAHERTRSAGLNRWIGWVFLGASVLAYAAVGVGVYQLYTAFF